ncbi:hypothetical protein RKT56_00265, partial [Streptococcus pneumoniae]|nr:hypothetical protein [Streptococcus pneumoniae]
FPRFFANSFIFSNVSNIVKSTFLRHHKKFNKFGVKRLTNYPKRCKMFFVSDKQLKKQLRNKL